MKSIQNLLDKYHERSTKVDAIMTELEHEDAKNDKSSPVAVPQITVPDYAREVIHPILVMLDKALPEYPLHVPTLANCCLEEGHYKIRIGVATIGGLSRFTNKDHRLYFISLFKKQILEQTEIKTMDDLIGLVKIELNKRGMLIQPNEPNPYDDER